MLNREAIENIQLIKDTANFVWGKQCGFGEVQVIEAPFSMFLLPLCLYGQFNIKLNYDRSTLSIDVPTQDGYKVLSRAANEKVFRGFDGLVPANLLHNFRVLDRVIRENELAD